MTGAMNLLLFALTLDLPTLAVGAGLRGLLLERSSPLLPLQRPPPATADAVFAQLQAPAPAPVGSPAGFPGPSPGPSPGPAPGGMPPEPKIPKITSATCAALQLKVGLLIGIPPAAPGPAPAPAPAAMLLQGGEGAAPGGPPVPTVECKIYAWTAGKPAGCNCFLEAPPPPFKPKVAGCPVIPNMLMDMGFTGDVVDLGSMAFGGQTGGWKRQTCVYRQWFFDPQLPKGGKGYTYQIKLNDARTEKYITDTYKASLNNAHNTAGAYWALTPVPWLQLYPTTPWPMSAPGPAPGGMPWGMPSTTPPILFANPPPTTPSMFGTTPSPFGTTPSPFGTPPPFGTTPAAGGFTTAPTYAVVR